MNDRSPSISTTGSHSRYSASSSGLPPMSISSSSKKTSERTASMILRARSQRWQPCAWYRTTLGIDSACRGRFGDALHRKTVSGKAHRGAAALHRPPGLVERARDDVVQLRVHLGLLPEVLLEPLDPFEVGNDDPSGVREDVRENEHALLLEDLVGGRRHRAVGALDNDF